MNVKPLIVALGGSTRPNSTTELAIRVCLKEAETLGAETVLLGGTDIAALPLYDPAQAEREAVAQRLIQLIRTCDGLIIGSPGYHGSISGLVKNALDYVEESRSDSRPYLDGRAVGCVACGAGWQAVGSTLVAMRSVVHALRGWPTPFAAGINTSEQQAFDANGFCRDPKLDSQLKLVGRQVMGFAHYSRGEAKERYSLSANWF